MVCCFRPDCGADGLWLKSALALIAKNVLSLMSVAKGDKKFSNLLRDNTCGINDEGQIINS